jgi:hypothetical protein
VAAVAFCAAGCGCGAGEGGDPDVTLGQTAAKLGDIHSGELDFRLSVEPKGNDTERVGWEVKGAFELGGGGRAAQFQVDYTQRRGDEDATVAVTLTGGKAYVALGDETYEMPSARGRALTEVGTALSGGQGLGELDIRAWLEDPQLSDGEDVGGYPTDRIRADLDVAATVRDLLALAAKTGSGSLGALTDADAKQLSDAVDHASVDVLTGKDDRLLRRLHLELDLGLDVPGPFRAALGSVAGAGVDLTLMIEHPNEAVSIQTPPDAHPMSELPGAETGVSSRSRRYPRARAPSRNSRRPGPGRAGRRRLGVRRRRRAFPGRRCGAAGDAGVSDRRLPDDRVAGGLRPPGPWNLGRPAVLGLRATCAGRHLCARVERQLP